MYYTDIDYIHGIKSKDDEVLRALYKQYFRMIRHYVITNHGDEYSAKDIYHETLLVLINAVQKETFVLTSSLSTLIFSIARRLWLKHLNKNKNTILFDDFQNNEPVKEDENHYIEEHEQKEQNIQKIQTALQSLGKPCYELLKEFYYHQLSMEQIANKLGYHNSDVAKNQKYKCLQRLKKYFFETQQPNYQPLNSSDYE
ncbi:MAG: sigma-70 family RNA polymerase sigma factor [Bacteroidia bacterium]|nr:sigma-70 family RNA polymerase sigma factor [Bacteroidia bacterium]